MAHPVKKVYKSGSPGAERRDARLTLSSIKKQIRQSSNKTATRRQFEDRGLLGAA